MAQVRALSRRYNARVFGGELPADLQITWSKHLSTTAGMTRYSRQAPQGLFGEHKCVQLRANSF